MGSPETAVTALEALVAAGHEVAAAVAQPDKPSGRGRRPQAPPVKVAAERLDIPVWQPRSWKSEEEVERLREIGAELLVVVAYGKILPRAVLESAPCGAVNLHFSLLPRWRGAAPVQRTVEAGETRTGVTTMQLDEGMDTGPILLQQEADVLAGEMARDLEARLATDGSRLLVETLAGMEAGAIESEPQDDSAATYARMVRKEEGEADWSLPAVTLHNRWRAFHPWPGLYTFNGGRRLVVEEAVADRGGASSDPGLVLGLEGDGLVVSCGEGVLLVRGVRPEGRKAMTGRAACNGRFVQQGDRLGSREEED
jgi:methionyl-tRNA formyltransferase